MAIHSSIPPVPPKRDADSAGDSQPKADAARSDDVAQGFRGAMSRSSTGSGGQSSGNNAGQGGTDVSAQDAPVDTTANTLVPASKPAPRMLVSDTPAPLSPAMLRLQQQGVTLAPTPTPTPKVQMSLRDEKVQTDEGVSDDSVTADDISSDANALGQMKPGIGVKTITTSRSPGTPTQTIRQQTSQPGTDVKKFVEKDDVSTPNKDPGSLTREVSGKDISGKDPTTSGKDLASTGKDLAASAKDMTSSAKDLTAGKGVGSGVAGAKGVTVRGDTSSVKDTKSASSADPRNIAAPVNAGVAPQPIQAAAPTDQPAATIPSAILQQVVDYATVHQNRDGFYEFQLGLNENMMGGMNIQVTALANRRVGLKVRSARGGSSLSDEDVQGLISALRARGVDVVDVDIA